LSAKFIRALIDEGKITDPAAVEASKAAVNMISEGGMLLCVRAIELLSEKAN
jgi:hypothetical protein